MDAGSPKDHELVSKSNTKLPSSNQNSATVVESDECFVCGDEHPLKDGVVTCWAHFACNDCLIKLFSHAANTAGFNYFPARCCPGGAALGIRLAEHLLTSDTVQTYKRKEYQLYLPEALLIYCPECSTWLSPESFHDEGPYSVVQCDNCNTTTCVGCKSKWQTDHRCHEAGGRADAKPEWLPAYTPEFRVKKCPKCRIYIEHRDACNTIECSHCRHCFCFVCLIPWAEDHDCPHYKDPEEDYDEDGYEKTPRGLHRDTGLDREGRNRLELSSLLAQDALDEDTTAGQILRQRVMGLVDLDVDEPVPTPEFPEPISDFGPFATDVYDNSWYGSWTVPERTRQGHGPDPPRNRNNIDEGYDEDEEEIWTGIIPWEPPSEVVMSKNVYRPGCARVPDLWGDWSKANVSRLSFGQLACNHKWRTWRASFECFICGDRSLYDNLCEECGIHICHDCELFGDTSEDYIGASGHNMVSVIQWAEQGESPWKAQHRADNDWFQSMEAQLGVARMFDHYERKYFDAHPFCYSDYGIKEMFEGLEESMRRAGSWYVAEDDVGFKGCSMSFRLDTNPFTPLLWEDDVGTFEREGEAEMDSRD